MLSPQIGQLTNAAIHGCPNASDRRHSCPNASDRRSRQSCPNANVRRGHPNANGLPIGQA
jgi:hypothetical protein